jgi:integrase
MMMRGCPPLTPAQVKATLRGLKGRYRWRDRAIVVLGIRTGLRIGELVALKIEDVWDGVRPRERVYLARKNAKGQNRGTSIILHPQAGAAIEKWISMRKTASGSDWLFPSQKSSLRPLGTKSAWAILHPVLIAAGVNGMRGTHVLRKSFALNVFRSTGNDLFRLSIAMRHTSPLTTLSYLSFRQEEIDRAILRA